MRKKYVFPALLFAAVLALSSVLLSSCTSSGTDASKNPAETDTSSLQESPTDSAEDPESIGNSGEIPDTSAESESETGGAIEMSLVPMETEATVRLVAVGDMLMHAGISNQAIQPDGSLNYDFLFANIREDLSEADLAVVNNEVIFGGDDLGALGYPYFSVPSALGDAEVRAGFNVILSATNHANDQGPSGIRNTLNFWKKYPEATLLGIHESPEAAQEVTVVVKNGIRIAMINLTYGLNVDWFPEGEDYLVELMTESTRPEIARKLEWAEENADFVIVFPHWGEEYGLSHDEYQRGWAEFFTECGADLIIGSHSHTVQESDWVSSSNGNEAYCVYSLGNYVSIQAMTINMLGKMPKITIEKNSDGCRITDVQNDYTFTYFNQALTDVQVYKMDQVTDEVLESHGVGTVHSELYDDMNAVYPLTMEVLKSLCK